jgi:hypothetical protein
VAVNFIVEDGSGVLNANALSSLEAVDQYHTDRGNAGWTGTDDAKKSAIIRGSDALRRYSGRWKGQPTYIGQSLDWPRYGVYLSDVTPELTRHVELLMLYPGALPDDEVPALVQAAVAELALRALAGPLMPDPDPFGRLIKEDTVGPITTIYETPPGTVSPSPSLPPAVEAILAPLLRSSSTLLRA